MKSSLFTLLVVGAGILEYATANPMRVVVISGNQEVSPNVRFGHAVSEINPSLAQIVRPNMPPFSTAINEAGPPRFHGRRPCHSGLIRAKAKEIANMFRQAFGFPPLEAHPTVEPGVPDGLVHILPYVGTGTHGEVVAPHDPLNHYRDRHDYFITKKPFLRRVHHALMSLGPWEGRAVAFVLGCGIGVLLRMFWVMTVITYRLIRGEREEAPYIEIVCDHYADAESIVIPPPQYISEKAELTEANKQTEEA